MDSTFTLVLSLVALMPIMYMYTVNVVQTRFPTLRNKRICLLIAHPDDEAMFFSPTVLSLTRPETGNHVKILCLSTGMFFFLRSQERESERELVEDTKTITDSIWQFRRCPGPWRD